MKKFGLMLILILLSMGCVGTEEVLVEEMTAAESSMAEAVKGDDLTHVANMPEAAEVDPHQKWLKQFVGEWVAYTKVGMQGSDKPMEMKSEESVKAIGDLWIIAEGRSENNGMLLGWVLTLGYNPAEKAIVGSWVDSTNNFMWRYTGDIDLEKNLLTLKTTGPSFSDPNKMVDYREVLELKNKDHRTFESSVLGEDGKWQTFVRGEYRRKK